MNSESRIDTTIGTSKKQSSGKNFGLNEYVKMFDDNEPAGRNQRNDSPDMKAAKKQGRVKIEYSDSSTESVSSDDQTRSDRKQASFNYEDKNANNDESDDDFKW